MDSLTQITLGAAVGEGVLGKDTDKKAVVWGGVLGTLPDLDVLANPFLTEAQFLLLHRGASHSLLVALLLSPLFGIGLARLHREGPSWQRWTLLAGAVLLTHIGLDCLTVYGTQVFWPFSRTPILVGSIFIIDPFYTVPLAAGLVTALFWGPTDIRRRWANYLGLGLSSTYLLLTLVNNAYMQRSFQSALDAQGLPSERVLTKPTALNNLLWMGISEGDDGFYIGYYSLLDPDRNISFRYEPKNYDLLGGAQSNPYVERLQWFSRGYYIVREYVGESLAVIDLRFGRNDVGLTEHGQYLFTFRLRRDATGTITGFTRDPPPVRLDGPLIRRFLRRIGGRRPAEPPRPGVDKRNKIVTQSARLGLSGR